MLLIVWNLPAGTDIWACKIHQLVDGDSYDSWQMEWMAVSKLACQIWIAVVGSWPDSTRQQVQKEHKPYMVIDWPIDWPSFLQSLIMSLLCRFVQLSECNWKSH